MVNRTQPHEFFVIRRTPAARLLLTVRSICAPALSLSFVAGLAALGDGISTIWALEQGHGDELNILAPTNLFWVIVVTIAKFAFTQLVHLLLRARHAIVALKLACAIWGGACVSNVFLIIGAPQISSISGAIGFICLIAYLSSTHWDFRSRSNRD